MLKIKSIRKPDIRGWRPGSWASALIPCLTLAFIAAGVLYCCAELEQHAIAARVRATDATRMTRADTGRLSERPPAMGDEYNRIEESRTEGESACRRALQPWRSASALFCNSDLDLFIPGTIRQVEKPPASGRQLQSLFTQEIPKRAGPAPGDGLSAA